MEKNLKIKEIMFNQKKNDNYGQYDFIYTIGNLRTYSYKTFNLFK